jgi:hypothetical protein
MVVAVCRQQSEIIEAGSAIEEEGVTIQSELRWQPPAETDAGSEKVDHSML